MGREGVGEGRTGKPGDYHDCNSLLKYLLALTAEKCVGKCRGSQGLEQIKNRVLEPCLGVISFLVLWETRESFSLPACCSAFLELADPCLLSLNNYLLGRLGIGWMFWPYWMGKSNLMAISTWGWENLCFPLTLEYLDIYTKLENSQCFIKPVGL